MSIDTIKSEEEGENMDSRPIVWRLFGIDFTFSILFATIVTIVTVLIIVRLLTRNITMRPNKGQTVMEMLIDFIQSIVANNMDFKIAGKTMTIFSLALFLMILVSNILDLPFFVEAGGYAFWNAPTANAVVCLALALLVILMSHYLAIQRFGFKQYVKQNYLEPVSFMLPIKLLEEFTNTLTLALRLYGNIYAGEVLIALLAKMGLALGLATVVPTVVLTVIWQGFSVMVSIIQAYVFVTLANVYIGHKLDHHQE